MSNSLEKDHNRLYYIFLADKATCRMPAEKVKKLRQYLFPKKIKKTTIMQKYCNFRQKAVRYRKIIKEETPWKKSGSG